MSTRVLIVKTSSLGDVLHTLPAVTEAAAARPELMFDWVVEPAFAEVPAWHPAVGRIIEAPLRALRRRPDRGALAGLAEALRARPYDRVIDAQGLIKSAVLTRLARGRRGGFDFASVRERPAALCYADRIAVPRTLHAVERLRRLFAALLDYPLAAERPDHGLDARVASLRRVRVTEEVLLLHGTSWPDKHWPEAHWVDLATRLAAEGHAVRVPFGSEIERGRAERIAEAGRGELVPHGSLAALLERLAQARGAVGVDAGPLHVAAAAGVPAVALYGPTDPARTGPWSPRIQVLRGGLSCEPCLARRCASPRAPLRGADGGALEPPCLGRITPGAVAGLLNALLAGS